MKLPLNETGAGRRVEPPIPRFFAPVNMLCILFIYISDVI
jgi:hypothetical protein